MAPTRSASTAAHLRQPQQHPQHRRRTASAPRQPVYYAHSAPLSEMRGFAVSGNDESGETRGACADASHAATASSTQQRARQQRLRTFQRECRRRVAQQGNASHDRQLSAAELLALSSVGQGATGGGSEERYSSRAAAPAAWAQDTACVRWGRLGTGGRLSGSFAALAASSDARRMAALRRLAGVGGDDFSAFEEHTFGDEEEPASAAIGAAAADASGAPALAQAGLTAGAAAADGAIAEASQERARASPEPAPEPGAEPAWARGAQYPEVLPPKVQAAARRAAMAAWRVDNEAARAQALAGRGGAQAVTPPRNAQEQPEPAPASPPSPERPGPAQQSPQTRRQGESDGQPARYTAGLMSLLLRAYAKRGRPPPPPCPCVPCPACAPPTMGADGSLSHSLDWQAWMQRVANPATHARNCEFSGSAARLQKQILVLIQGTKES